MPITIRNPQPLPSRSVGPTAAHASQSDSESDSEGGVDLQGDVPMRAPKRLRHTSKDDQDEILTPGSIITNNPQWMRYVNVTHQTNLLSFSMLTLSAVVMALTCYPAQQPSHPP